MRVRLESAGNAMQASPGAGSGAARLSVVSVSRTLPSPEDPAAGTFVAHRLAALARLCDTRILQPVPFFPLLKPLPGWAQHGEHLAAGVPVAPLRMLYLPGALKSLDGFWLKRSVRATVVGLQREGRVDLIDAHFGYPDGVGCVRLGAELGVPVFVTIRGSETDLLKVPRIGPQLAESLNAAAGCISVSYSLRRTVMEHGVDGERVHVIPNAVDRRLFRPGPRDVARQALGIDPLAPLVVSIGHLVRGKGHDLLLRALAQLRRRLPRARLTIVGGPAYDRGYPERLARLVGELSLVGQVTILGRVPQVLVSRWLQAADVYALATHREGCCNSVLEALAAGRPVVTTPVGDNANYVRPGVNGLLVPVGDVSALAAALETALGRDWDAEEISRRLDVGGWDDVASRVLAFFRERLTCRPGTSRRGAT